MVLSNTKVLVGLLALTLVVVLALGASYIAPYDPVEMHPVDRLQPPSGKYLLGTDLYGRDILSRILYGYRGSLLIAFSSVAFAFTVGSPLGIIAGYRGKLADTLIMRVMDLLLAFPVFLLAIVMVVIMGTGTTSTILAIGIVYTPIFARISRGPTLAVKEEPFVESAKAIGAINTRILLSHILPNIAAPIFIQTTIQLAKAVLFEASLSFLGLGTQPPNPSLGLMISENRNVVQLNPWPTFFSGLAIAVLVLGVNLLGDGLREVLDPKMRGRGS